MKNGALNHLTFTFLIMGFLSKQLLLLLLQRINYLGPNCFWAEPQLSHLRQGGPGPRALGGHGEHGRDSQSHPSRRSIHVDPEGHPRKDDGEQAGDVHLNQVVTHLTLQVELHLYTGEFT